MTAQYKTTNWSLLKRVAKAILAEPEGFEMGSWFFGPNFGPNSFACHEAFKELTPKDIGCGTTCCISGWAALLYNQRAPRLERLAPYAGEYALRLSDDERYRLFYFHSWPEKFRRRYQLAKTPRGKARAGYDRIMFFIATEGTDDPKHPKKVA